MFQAGHFYYPFPSYEHIYWGYVSDTVLLGMLHKMTLLYITYITRLNSTAHDTRDRILLIVVLI